MKWKNAAEAYWWVYEHPCLLCEGFVNPWVEITPHMVDGYGVINPDPQYNLYLEWWVECGPYIYETVDPFNYQEKEFTILHDTDLDCGGKTAEEAIMKLAELVLENYGDYDADNN